MAQNQRPVYKRVSKLDYILKPFLFLRINFNFASLGRLIKKIRREIFWAIKKQKNVLTRFILYAIASLLLYIWYAVIIVLYLAYYTLVTVITTVLVILIALPLGIFLGLLPFVLKTTYMPERVEEDRDFSGIRVLLLPTTWSFSFFKFSNRYFHRTSMAPWAKLFELQFSEYTHIIFSISLWIALMISAPLYGAAIWLVGNLTSGLLVILISIISYTLYIIASTFVWTKEFIATGNEDNREGVE